MTITIPIMLIILEEGLRKLPKSPLRVSIDSSGPDPLLDCLFRGILPVEISRPPSRAMPLGLRLNCCRVNRPEQTRTDLIYIPELPIPPSHSLLPLDTLPKGILEMTIPQLVKRLMATFSILVFGDTLPLLLPMDEMQVRDRVGDRGHLVNPLIKLGIRLMRRSTFRQVDLSGASYS